MCTEPAPSFLPSSLDNVCSCLTLTVGLISGKCRLPPLSLLDRSSHVQLCTTPLLHNHELPFIKAAPLGPRCNDTLSPQSLTSPILCCPYVSNALFRESSFRAPCTLKVARAVSKMGTTNCIHTLFCVWEPMCIEHQSRERWWKKTDTPKEALSGKCPHDFRLKARATK